MSLSSSPLSRRRIPMSPGHPVRGRKRASRRRRRRRRCEGVSSRVSLLSLSLSRYFMTFCFQSAGRRRRGITEHLGPYSTFMALNRDEVSHEWTNVLSSSSRFFFYPFSVLSFFFTSLDRNRFRSSEDSPPRKKVRSVDYSFVSTSCGY